MIFEIYLFILPIFFMTVYYALLYMICLNKYMDLKYLFFFNKIYDIIGIIFFISIISDNKIKIFIKILLIINLISIIFITYKVLKNKEKKKRILYAVLSHSECWLFYLLFYFIGYLFFGYI